MPVLPTFADYDRGTSRATHFQAFRVYVPWVEWAARASLPADYLITGVNPDNDTPLAPPDLSRFLAADGRATGLATQTGPFVADTGGYVPAGEALPFTVQFQNDPEATTSVGEVRVVVDLDPDLDARTFRLGDLKVGDISLAIPAGRAVFQGEFDFVRTRGFVLRVSAGVDVATHKATWLIQAIDPLTGEVVTDPARGLLPPNNARGQGAGFVGYSIEPLETAPGGAELVATARVLFDTAPPEDAAPLRYVLDASAPTTAVTAVRTGNDYQVAWNATDAGGSGVKHVTLYVAEAGGAFRIWRRQVTEAEGTLTFIGEPGRTYEFLGLATDVAGNREQAAPGRPAP
ncbi:MAG: hypothetical protein K2X36_10715, partial [Microbacteriaceae bacterium]|nr:hypothetical protein [Microbacteriaceae bacterium]